MHTLLESNLRAQLLDRRARLRMLVEDPALRRADDLVGLLETVDAALARMDAGSYGQCELCHESVDDDWLAAKPLIQYCLCELSPRQQAALEHDLALARRIQLGLLPAQDFTAGGWETHFRYIPAGPVSGDYCDLVAPRDGHAPSGTAPTAALYALLGDVSGKGVAAALLMARLSALFRGLIELNLPLPELFARASRLFAEGAPSTHFATLVCARAEASGAVELCNAGHCEPLVVRRGEVRPVESSGAPLGLADHGPYETHRVRLAPGDALVLYSDGITEASAADGQMFAEAGLARALARNHERSPANMAAAVLADMAEFRGSVRPADDLTLMVLRRTVPAVV